MNINQIYFNLLIIGCFRILTKFLPTIKIKKEYRFILEFIEVDRISKKKSASQIKDNNVCYCI